MNNSDGDVIMRIASDDHDLFVRMCNTSLCSALIDGSQKTTELSHEESILSLWAKIRELSSTCFSHECIFPQDKENVIHYHLKYLTFSELEADYIMYR